MSVSAVIGLVGAILLAVQRSTQPPATGRIRGTARSALPLTVLLPVSGACLALGAVFGGMEVVVVAFAKEAGVLPFAGVFITIWSFGSLLAGVVTGGIAWRSTPATRFRLGATALALSLLPLPFVASPLPVGALLLVSGMAIAPTLIASVAVIESVGAAIPADRGTQLDDHRDGARSRGRCRRDRSPDRSVRGPRRVLRGGRGRPAAARLVVAGAVAPAGAQPSDAR